VNFNVNFNVLLSKYIVHPLVKTKKDFDMYVCYFLRAFLTVIKRIAYALCLSLDDDRKCYLFSKETVVKASFFEVLSWRSNQQVLHASIIYSVTN
jgi:hypothetical protein